MVEFSRFFLRIIITSDPFIKSLSESLTDSDINRFNLILLDARLSTEYGTMKANLGRGRLFVAEIN